MKLASHSHGNGPSLTFVHGFTQTKESWLPVLESLTDDYECVIIDAPGHGQSNNGQRTLQQAGDDVAETMKPGILIGYSMGARISLHAALQRPETVTALVLISGTAGLETADERLSRRQSDETLASHISEVGVPTFIDEWLSNPMFSGLPTSLADIPSRCTNTAQGLGDSLRFAGTGTQEPMWNMLSQLQIPVLLIAGNNDQKFVQLARRMNELIPNSELHIMENVGHTCHLENIAAFTAIFKNWLSRVKSDK